MRKAFQEELVEGYYQPSQLGEEWLHSSQAGWTLQPAPQGEGILDYKLEFTSHSFLPIHGCFCNIFCIFVAISILVAFYLCSLDFLDLLFCISVLKRGTHLYLDLNGISYCMKIVITEVDLWVKKILLSDHLVFLFNSYRINQIISFPHLLLLSPWSKAFILLLQLNGSPLWMVRFSVEVFFMPLVCSSGILRII